MRVGKALGVPDHAEVAVDGHYAVAGAWLADALGNLVSRYVHLAAEDAKAVLERMNEKISGS